MLKQKRRKVFIFKLFVNNSEFKYDEKAEKICIEFVDTLRAKISYDFLLDGGWLRSREENTSMKKSSKRRLHLIYYLGLE